MPRVWLITGISRGLGRSLAKTVLAGDDLVIGTTRDGKTPADLISDNLTILPLEVTDRRQAEHLVVEAHQRHGRLDVVVNNAGYGLLGPIEATTPDQSKHAFAVNFFGPLEIIRAALPLLRKQRSGHIVNISSIAGVAPMAGSGIYAATKFALEGMSQSLAQEVAPFGILVTLVEPGAFRTDFLTSQSVRRTEHAIDDYAASGVAIDNLLSNNGRQLGDPDRAAAAILEAVGADEPPLNLLLGRDALDRANARLTRFEEDLMRWERVTLSTDFNI